MSENESDVASDTTGNDVNNYNRSVWLDVIDVLGKALIAPSLVAAVGLYGYTTSRSASKDDVAEKYTSLAVDILKGKPDPSNNEIRKWAAKTLDRYSEVPFTEEGIKQLQENPLLGNPVSFDVTRQDTSPGGDGNVYLIVSNANPDPITITSIAILGPDNLVPPCIINVSIDPVNSIAFSNQPHAIKLVTPDTIVQCLKVTSEYKNYRLLDASKTPTFDAFDKRNGYNYSTKNLPFGISVQYDGKLGHGSMLFGAYFHYLKTDRL